MPSAPSRTRATALPPSERRAEIIAATLPLVLAHGAAVTTRQIAEAAGIAEGTIFRVFPDKESLIEAVVESAFDSTVGRRGARSRSTPRSPSRPGSSRRSRSCAGGSPTSGSSAPRSG